MPITDRDVLLVHLFTPPPDGWIEKAAEAFNGLQVRWAVTKSNPALHDTENIDSLPNEMIEGVTMLCVVQPPSPRNMKNVSFVQLYSAGHDRWLDHDRFLDPAITFCSGSGCHAPQMAEWVIASWLSHEHHFSTYAEQQKQCKFLPRLDKSITDAQQRRMGIVGYGAIGRQVAHLARAFGMEISAYTRSPRETPASRKHNGYSQAGTGDPDGSIPTRWFSGNPREAMTDFLSQGLDIVVISIPLDDSTRHLFGREQFRLLASRGKQKTFVTNVARGGIIDQEALIEALELGHISGAALDVTDPEPLPADHPLWKAPNVFITPHISWQSTGLVDRICDKLWQNLERLHKNEPLMDVIRTP